MAEPLDKVIAAIAPDKYLTWEGTSGYTEKTIHLWTVQKTGPPTLTDSMSIGEINIGSNSFHSNDTGTIAIYGGRTSPATWEILHPYLVGDTLAYHTVDLTDYGYGYVDRFFVSMDGLEFVTQSAAYAPGNVIRGYAVDGTGTPWEVQTLKDVPGFNQSTGWLLGVPAAGRFIWADDRAVKRTKQTLSTFMSQATVATNTYGSPTYDLTYRYSFDGLSPGESVLDMYFDNFSRLAFLQYATPPTYSPPAPTGGTLSFDGTVVVGNISASLGIEDFVPSGYGYPQYWARTGNFAINNTLINWSIVPETGTFDLVFTSTPPTTGTAYNGGWGGFVTNVYYYPLPWDWYYENDFISYFNIYQVRSNPHAKEIQLWSSDGEILDFLPFEHPSSATQDGDGFWSSYTRPVSQFGSYDYLLGCGDAFYLAGWRRLTWAGDQLTLTEPTFDTNLVPPVLFDADRHIYGMWDGQVAIVMHDHQPSSGG